MAFFQNTQDRPLQNTAFLKLDHGKVMTQENICSDFHNYSRIYPFIQITVRLTIDS